VKQQQTWIIENLRKKDGYYLKIIDLDDNGFCGTVSIYNVKERQAEFGRYICIKSLQAIETEYLVLEYAFNSMNLDRVYCRTAELNSKVWRQHIRYGFSDTGTEIFHNKGKELKLKVQEITSDTFRQKDYYFIRQIIQRF
jgi:diamine N-acetyltransferase